MDMHLENCITPPTGRSPIRDPLTKVFQYEYALYTVVADLFESVRCKSMCVDTLKLYFRELGHKPDRTDRLYGDGIGDADQTQKYKWL